MKRILVIGGGFAGLSAALVAADEIEQHGGDISVTLVSPAPYLTIRPRLYEPHPDSLREPLLPIVTPVGVEFIEARAQIISVDEHRVETVDEAGRSTWLDFDKLILTAGSSLVHAGIPGAGAHAFDIDTFDAARRFDEQLKKIAAAPNEPGNNTIVIIGAGMSGIELATEMRSRIEIHGSQAVAAGARIVLVDRNPEIGAAFGDEAQALIVQALDGAGVEVVCGTDAVEITASGIRLGDGTWIGAATTVLTVGLRANALADQISGRHDSQGRLFVSPRLEVEGTDNVFAAGDVAHALVDDGRPAMMACQHSRTMGKYAGFNAARSLMGLPLRDYRQPVYVTCLDLGDSGAVFTTGWDRQLESAGDEAKARKQLINRELIYPPSGSKAEILAGIRIDEKTGR